MVHLLIEKGLDIPIKGGPIGAVDSSGKIPLPSHIALDLEPFEEVKFHLLVKPGQVVKRGEALLEDKSVHGLNFVSPAGGTIEEIRRGLKRRLLSIVIRLQGEEEVLQHPTPSVSNLSRKEIIDQLKKGGLFAHIRQRPFNSLANPNLTPRAIFVKAVESAPFTPPSEMQVEGYEKEFQTGLTILSKLTDGPVHLVYHHRSTFSCFREAKEVTHHTIEGPHPIGTHSLHIHYISPIRHPEEVIWTLTAYDVVCIGHLFLKGAYLGEKVISIAGPSIVPERSGYFRVRSGTSIDSLILNRLEKGHHRLISGDPLMGKKVERGDFLGFYHTVFSVIPEDKSRKFLHFLRSGIDRFSASRAYLSGWMKGSHQEYDFTTSLHGERRGFITGEPYMEVMPMKIPVMLLVRATMAEDYELAEKLGLLEVDQEDFALSTFVDPSKIEMVGIMKEGLKNFSKEVLS